MQIVFGILVAIHGLITVAVGMGSASNTGGVTAPGTSWYPVALGQSWLLQGDVARLGGGLWVIAGIGLLATAASVFGIVLPSGAWPTLGLISAVTALAALALFFHPYYAIAIVANLAIVAAATVFRATSKSVLGI
jgi:hypothetical protein